MDIADIFRFVYESKCISNRIKYLEGDSKWIL